MRRMPLLPQGILWNAETDGFLFPAYYGTPLVVHLWQITVRLDQIFIKSQNSVSEVGLTVTDAPVAD
mgnify:CR=1 FL=1